MVKFTQDNMLELNNVYNGDCLEIMKSIDDKSIDMILCDLPYGVLNKGNQNVKWDSVIPFNQLWKQYRRITKENSAIVLFGSEMFTAKLMLSAKDLWRYNLIWYKTLATGFLNANKMPLRKHEDILVFYSKLPIYNPQFEKCEPRMVNTRRKTNNCYGKMNAGYPHVSDVKFPNSVLKFGKDGKQEHPTQKPLKLCEYLIKTYSNEGDLILDNCCGSGTTCLAAKNTNRNYIGIEKEKKYFDISNQRLQC